VPCRCAPRRFPCHGIKEALTFLAFSNSFASHGLDFGPPYQTRVTAADPSPKSTLVLPPRFFLAFGLVTSVYLPCFPNYHAREITATHTLFPPPSPVRITSLHFNPPELAAFPGISVQHEILCQCADISVPTRLPESSLRVKDSGKGRQSNASAIKSFAL